MNHENVLKVADRIENLPYAKASWASVGKPEAFCMATACGTACCVAGWVCWIFREEAYRTGTRAILGLNQDQAQALFKPPGFDRIRHDGSQAAQVLRLMAAAGDDVTGR